ncbi:hypothetical protein ACVIJ6_001145 [Bradyrhizobium sp. USDA 4369]
MRTPTLRDYGDSTVTVISGSIGRLGGQEWRIVFRWTDAGPEDVEIIDYH